MDISQKIYVFSKKRQIVEQKVGSFVKNMTEVQKMCKDPVLVFLIEKSKRLLVQLEKWEGRVLAGLAAKKLTLGNVNQEWILLCKMERLYHDYSSEYNEILQTLLSYKLEGNI